MRRAGSVALGLLAFLLALVVLQAQAQRQIVVYTCTDARGHVSMQNGKPCTKGSRQERQVIDAPAPAPTVVAPLAPLAVAPAAQPPRTAATPDRAPATQVAAADLLPPPPLYQCTTYDNDSYLGEDAHPPQRCVPLQTTGLGGDAALANGAACQMVSDQCQRIPDNAVCDAWKRHARELEAAWKFARADKTDAARDDFERVSKILSESTCAAPPAQGNAP